MTHTMMTRVFAAAAALTVAACSREGGPRGEWSPAKLSSVRGVPATEIEAAIQGKLADDAPAGIDREQWRHTRRLYQSYGRNPLWLTSDGLHQARSEALTDAILAANEDALRLDDYPIARLANALGALKSAERPTAEQLAEADVVLSATYAALGEDMLTGHVDPRSVAQSWFVDPQEEKVDSALARGLRNEDLGASLRALRPTDADYQGLRVALAQYRQIVARGGFPRVPPTRAVRIGAPMDPAVAAAVRARLQAEGITVAAPAATDTGRAQAPASGGVYDRSLAAAVAQFQARYTIAVDSMLGAATLEAMNRPATYRLAQIAANMERFRWLPRHFGARHIFVNVPGFRLEAYDGGRKVLEMKVIVGAEYEQRATPVFSDSMETVVFRPYWLVPPEIAANEIFPRGSAYLASNDMEVYTAGGETRVRQRPGPENALGLVKFLFPNGFAIYLHDTPNDELFKEDVRAFSHGCIRVEKPELLANYVLGWPVERVRQAMENGPNDRAVRVPQKIPVYIAYLTAFVRNGRLHFGNDIYSRDDRLLTAIAPAAVPTAQAVQAVQALRRVASR